MHPREIKAAYDHGENLTELLRRESGAKGNTEDAIEIAYDLQTGSYVAALDDSEYRKHKIEYGRLIAEELTRLAGPSFSALEPGVGEGTTLSFVHDACGQDFHGFDISWSRVAKCREWLFENGIDAFLSVASIFHAPYLDNSFDIVYTSHTIEPNGGNEELILKELYRVASKYLVLLEPAYEFANDEQRARMDRLGYVRGLKEHAERLSMNVVKQELFPCTANLMNPTAITVIEKNPTASPAIPMLACPRYGDTINDCFYSAGSMRAYPTIKGIPCLRPDDGIIASQYEAAREMK